MSKGEPMDILERIKAYDCSDGGHSDAAQGSAYDLMHDAANEIEFWRTILQQIAHSEVEPVTAAREALGELYDPAQRRVE
jgi:hypothetical protein